MVLWWEAIISNEAMQYVGKHPASIGKLKNGTRILMWGIIEIPTCEYQTYRWLSDKEKETIDMISEWNVIKIQAILSNYI